MQIPIAIFPLKFFSLQKRDFGFYSMIMQSAILGFLCISVTYPPKHFLHRTQNIHPSKMHALSKNVCADKADTVPILVSVFWFPCPHNASITQVTTFGCLNPPSTASGIAAALFQISHFAYRFPPGFLFLQNALLFSLSRIGRISSFAILRILAHIRPVSVAGNEKFPTHAK